jgi:L-2-hydroxyglutarate oxidase LhgO
MAQAFTYPEYGVQIFGAGILGATVAFGLASRWNRA